MSPWHIPSYYEPWGYTPLEALASGIPSVTSDLSGICDYIMHNFPDHDKAGMFIVERRNRDFNQSIEPACRHSVPLSTQQNRRERIAMRNNC